MLFSAANMHKGSVGVLTQLLTLMVSTYNKEQTLWLNRGMVTIEMIV